MKTYTEDDLREAFAAIAPADVAPLDIWTSVRSRIARRRRVRLALSAVGVAAAATIGLVAWPEPGPDTVGPSEGAKSVVLTLELRDSPPRSVTAATLDALRKRLDGLGIAGATISVLDGRHLAVTAPSADLQQLNDLGQRGELQLRQVLSLASRADIPTSWSVATAPDLTQAKSLFAHSSCSAPNKRLRRHPTSLRAPGYLVACSVDTGSIYLLGPSPVTSADVASADVQTDTTGGWFVNVSLTPAGSAAWRNLTQAAAQQPSMQQCGPPGGCNGIAIVVDGRILSVPAVQGGAGLRGGMLQIPVRSREEARTLAVDLAHPLPLNLDYVSAATTG